MSKFTSAIFGANMHGDKNYIIAFWSRVDCTQRTIQMDIVEAWLTQPETSMFSEEKIISLVMRAMPFFSVEVSLFDLSNSNHHDHLPYVWYP